MILGMKSGAKKGWRDLPRDDYYNKKENLSQRLTGLINNPLLNQKGQPLTKRYDAPQSYPMEFGTSHDEWLRWAKSMGMWEENKWGVPLLGVDGKTGADALRVKLSNRKDRLI